MQFFNLNFIFECIKKCVDIEREKKNYIKNPEKTILLSDNMFDYIV